MTPKTINNLPAHFRREARAAFESLRTEWWRAFRLPVNWKLAQEAFQGEPQPIDLVEGFEEGAVRMAGDARDAQ